MSDCSSLCLCKPEGMMRFPRLLVFFCCSIVFIPNLGFGVVSLTQLCGLSLLCGPFINSELQLLSSAICPSDADESQRTRQCQSLHAQPHHHYNLDINELRIPKVTQTSKCSGIYLFFVVVFCLRV